MRGNNKPDAHKMWGCWAAVSANRDIKKRRFFRRNIKRLTWFTSQPKSVTEIGLWLLQRNFEK